MLWNLCIHLEFVDVIHFVHGNESSHYSWEPLMKISSHMCFYFVWKFVGVRFLYIVMSEQLHHHFARVLHLEVHTMGYFPRIMVGARQLEVIVASKRHPPQGYFLTHKNRKWYSYINKNWTYHVIIWILFFYEYKSHAIQLVNTT